MMILDKTVILELDQIYIKLTSKNSMMTCGTICQIVILGLKGQMKVEVDLQGQPDDSPV